MKTIKDVYIESLLNKEFGEGIENVKYDLTKQVDEMIDQLKQSLFDDVMPTELAVRYLNSIKELEGLVKKIEGNLINMDVEFLEIQYGLDLTSYYELINLINSEQGLAEKLLELDTAMKELQSVMELPNYEDNEKPVKEAKEPSLTDPFEAFLNVLYNEVSNK